MNQIMINSTVKKSQIVDNGNHWLIKGIPVTVDNAKMNKLVYSAEENAKGMPTINKKPITGGHPVSEGYPISVNDDMSAWYIGSNVTNQYNINGVNYVDVKASKKMMRNSDNKLGEYFANKLEKKSLLVFSTGLHLLPFKNDSGEMIATNQNYDHLAFLHDDEAPAGGKDTMVKFNADAEVMVVNIDDLLLESGHDVSNQECDHDERLLKRLMNRLVSVFGNDDESRYNQEGTGGKPDELNTNEDDSMRNEMIAGLKAKGITVNSDISDAELLAKYTDSATVTNKSDDTQALVASISALTAKVDTLSTNMEDMKKDAKSKEELEKEEKATKVANLDIGINKEVALTMSVNALNGIIAKNSPITANAHGGLDINSDALGEFDLNAATKAEA